MTPPKAARWSRLDNAAKIFPSTSTKEDTKVFRFSCELFEAVEPALLAPALEQTMAAFPFYRNVLRKGMFWYFFEESTLVPCIEEEHEPPCAPLYDPNRQTLLFAVTYYRRRIHLEVYHALADGAGALQFLRTLVAHYLARRHPGEVRGPGLDYDASQTEKADDSFARYYSGDPAPLPRKKPRAYRLSGEKEPDCRLKIVEGVLPVREVIARAHEYGATLTEFLGAVMLRAIYGQMPVRQRRLPVVLSVPVNLRKYFSSVSARNFFSVISVGYDFKNNSPELRAVAAELARIFNRELNATRLSSRLNELSAVEHNRLLSLLPLGVKDTTLRVANYMGELEITAALSNIGRVQMPPEMVPFIRLFDVFVSTRRLQLCLCSFEDNLALSFTSPFTDTDIQKSFFRELAGMGMDVEIITNYRDE